MAASSLWLRTARASRGLLGFALATVSSASPSWAQRARDDLGIAAERDGGERPLGDGIHFAGETRLRVEIQDNTPLGPRPNRGDGLAYFRLLGAADVRQGPLRAYVQAGTRLEAGLNGPSTPLSTDRLDVQQAFAELDLGPPERRLRVRAGRQEMAFEFVSARNSPNVRRTWDGGRATAILAGWEVDAFAVRLVAPRLGAFDDSSARSDRLTGVHLLSPDDATRPFYLSGYAYDVDLRAAPVFPQPQAARVRTVGGAIDGHAGHLLYRAGGARQWGRVGDRALSAYAYEGLIGVTFPDAVWKPTFALRTDGFSGGSPDAVMVGTFNPLFPDYAYSTEAALQSPSNLRKAGVNTTVERGALQLRYRAEGLWRFSARDAFYGPAAFAPIAPDGTDHRWIGFQQQLLLLFDPSERLSFMAALVRFDPGRFLRRQGRDAQNFAMGSVEWRF